MEPRVFALGKVQSVDTFKETAHVRFLDPFGYRQFYEDIVPPVAPEVPLELLDHCHIFKDSMVIINNRKAKIIEYKGSPNDEFEYYIQYLDTKKYDCVKESKITASFLSGKANPVHQLKRYEFHNPCWYFGKQVVKRTMSVLDNSIFGFKELAGCKIYLKAFQLNTIMQCLQSEKCRYMIADEVGLGKTIEACSILKIYLSNESGKRVLIATPSALLSQWKTELLFKFGMYEGIGANNNTISIMPVEKITNKTANENWDFVIVDEVHNYLADYSIYEKIYSVSCHSDNILLLSATPIQQRAAEYLKLLKLVLPNKYGEMTNEDFTVLVSKQNKVSRLTYSLLDEMDTLKNEVLPEISCEDQHNDEEVIEVLEEIQSYLESLSSIINDPTLNSLIDNIDFSSDDFGMYSVQVIVAYICDNYQIERNIIRGRRAVLGVYPKNSDGEFSERKLVELNYTIEDKLFYENEAYQSLVKWLSSYQNNIDDNTINRLIKPLLESFFSSPWAYQSRLLSLKGVPVSEDVLASANRWVLDENSIIENISDVLDDADSHPSRLVRLLEFVDTNLYGKKVVIFTDYNETFDTYYKVFHEAFGDEVTGFSKTMDPDEAEYNIYRFQTDDKCKILFCDKSGGEGRNFQIADYIVHIDLPWNISSIEQRIGRLDRLGRNVEVPVTSVVIHTSNTYEDQLFDFWNKGLDVFRQSLSGLEIIMNDINQKIYDALKSDIESGLSLIVPDLINEAEKMRNEVKKEQLFDTAAVRFRPLYIQLNKLLSNYQFNENKLFAETMMSWASLSGFGDITHAKNDSIVIFSKNNFSFRSAQNSFLIPPDWEEYISRKENELSIRILRRNKTGDDRIDKEHSIQGTFDRDVAIKNDYIHFYAPGDEIFDCITDNALHSYRAMCTAFAARSHFDWTGFIYTYSVEPNIRLLLDAGIPLNSLSLFKQYLGNTIKTVIVPFSKYSDIPEKQVLDEHRKLYRHGYFNNDDYIEHLGKRSRREGGFLGIPQRYDVSNLEWFKGKYYDEQWNNLVEQSYKLSKSLVKEKSKQESDVRGMRDLIDQIVSANESRARFYGTASNEALEKLKEQYEIICESIEKPIYRIESVCFMWLRK